MFKVNNKSTRATSMMLFFVIVDFEQVNVSWVCSQKLSSAKKFLQQVNPITLSVYKMQILQDV